MTDTITPAVAHRVLDVLEQSPHIGPDGSLSALFIIRDAVKAWEAELDREEEAEFYAKVYHRTRRRKSPVLAKWDSLPDDARADNIHIMRVVLDRLAADGRLLPEGAHCPNCLVALVGVEEEDTPPAVSVPDSGPDGTPEKPWPNLRAVPVPVREVRDRHGLRWERHSDTEWRGCDWSSACAAGHPEDAPFVRVDGDKA